MNRREFFTTAGIISATTYMSACGSSNSTTQEQTQPKPAGALSLYYEFKIAGPEIQNMMSNVSTQATALESKTGFLSLSLKQMIGDSTMVNNFDPSLKGVLRSAYVDAAQAGRRPFIYTLLIRFDSYDNLIASGAKDWFTSTIEPQLFAYTKDANGNPVKTPLPLDYYQGIYQTVAAGDANGVYTTQADIVTFLKNQKDVANTAYQAIPSDGTTSGASISVENHVSIDDANTTTVNTKATALLTVAQQTFQPYTTDANGNIVETDGTAGTLSDSNYQKAVTTEIMQNAYANGSTRDYLFHGVWKSVADHENSHVDPRFMQAAGPVGAYVVAGPWEPFYQTMIVHNNPNA